MSITIDRVALLTKPPKKPIASEWGYVITEDGTTYALLYRFYHGVVLALLYPDVFRDYRFKPGDEPQGYHFNEDGTVKMEPPPHEDCAIYGKLERLVMPADREDINVIHFQRFELDVHEQFPIVRVCPTRAVGVGIDVPRYHAVTKAQIEALQLIGQAFSWNRSTEVFADNGDMRWHKFIEWCQLREPHTRAPEGDSNEP